MTPTDMIPLLAPLRAEATEHTLTVWVDLDDGPPVSVIVNAEKFPPTASTSAYIDRIAAGLSAVTLAIFAALALLLLFTGCGPVAGPYLHTGLDSADTGELGAAYADVAGLPGCHVPYVELPVIEGQTLMFWEVTEVYDLVYGDPNAPRGVPLVYGALYVDGEGGEVVTNGFVDLGSMIVNFTIPVRSPFPEGTRGIALACPAPE